MKNIIFCMLFALIGCAGQTQTPTPSDATVYAMPANKKAVLNLPFGGMITVKTSDQPTLQFRTLITTEKEEYRSLHEVEVQDSKDKLYIETGYGKNLEKRGINCFSCDSTGTKNMWMGNMNGKSRCICFEVNYEITVPAGTDLSIETISSNIEIRGHTGALTVKSISGFVDIDLPATANASLDIQSVTGEIYTDHNLQLDENSTEYDKSIAVALGKGGERIALETVSGDIFFRKR